MRKRFNPPPNWPKPPANWEPPTGWAPDPSWGPVPEGWQLWVDDQPGTGGTTVRPPDAPAYGVIQGAVQPRKRGRARWVVIPLLLVLVLFVGCTIVLSMAGSQSGGSQLSSKNIDPVSQEQVDSAAELTERDLAMIVKSPDDQAGKTVVIYANITQFDAATGDCIFRANVSHQRMENSWEYDENAIFTGEGGRAGCAALKEFDDEDQLRITATSLGSISYDTQIGGNTTVPAFRVEKIEALTP